MGDYDNAFPTIFPPLISSCEFVLMTLTVGVLNVISVVKGNNFE